MAFSIKPADEQADAGLAVRYRSRYKTAKLLEKAGKILMNWICWIYGMYHLVFQLISVTSIASFNRYPGPVRPFLLTEVVPALYQTLFVWVMGLVLVSLSHILTAILDIAINTSPSPDQ